MRHKGILFFLSIGTILIFVRAIIETQNQRNEVNGPDQILLYGIIALFGIIAGLIGVILLAASIFRTHPRTRFGKKFKNYGALVFVPLMVYLVFVLLREVDLIFWDSIITDIVIITICCIVYIFYPIFLPVQSSTERFLQISLIFPPVFVLLNPFLNDYLLNLYINWENSQLLPNYIASIWITTGLVILIISSLVFVVACYSRWQNKVEEMSIQHDLYPENNSQSLSLS